MNVKQLIEYHKSEMEWYKRDHDRNMYIYHRNELTKLINN